MKKRMVFISPRFLFPADSGGKIRTTQILRGLKGNQFHITLVMPGTAELERKYRGQVTSVCDELITWKRKGTRAWVDNLRKVALLTNKFPIPVASDIDRDGAHAVAEALKRNPDVVVFDFPHSAVLAPERIECPSVMFSHNIETEIFERHLQVARFLPYRLLWRNQCRKMRKFEQAAMRMFDSVIAVSERDCEFFRRNYGIERCQAIPTGVDTEFFNFSEPRDPRQVVFCGSMDWLANIDAMEFFFDRVWPLILQQVPDAKMKVVGRTPPSTLVSRIRGKSDEWTFTGYVEDVRDHLSGAAAFVIPLRVGGGTRIKAFEAMAIGVPVVSTSIGVEGLPLNDGTHYLRADDPSAMAQKVVSLLEDGELRHRISISARDLVENKFGFRRAAEVFEQACLDAIASKNDSWPQSGRRNTHIDRSMLSRR